MAFGGGKICETLTLSIRHGMYGWSPSVTNLVNLRIKLIKIHCIALRQFLPNTVHKPSVKNFKKGNAA